MRKDLDRCFWALMGLTVMFAIGVIVFAAVAPKAAKAGPLMFKHTVVFAGEPGQSLLVPLSQGRNCVYVTDCSANPDPAPPPVSTIPTPRGTPGWTFGVLIDVAGISVTANMREVYAKYGPMVVLDGDPVTKWHTPFRSANPDKGTPHPHYLILDLGGEHWVDSLIYTPRKVDPTNSGTKNGIISDYEVWVSSDLNIWRKVAGGTLAYTDDVQPEEMTIEFLIPNQARYVKLVALSDIMGSPYASAGEVRVTESLKDVSIFGGAVQ